MGERLIKWDDPVALAGAAKTMAGRDFLMAMVEGKLPPPPICHLADFTFTKVGDGSVEMEFHPHQSQYNPIGSVHGGVIATILDSAMGCAVHTIVPLGRAYTTLEIKVNYLRAVSQDSGIMTAIGKVIHSGRQTAVAEASMMDAKGKIYAHATTTCLLFDIPSRK